MSTPEAVLAHERCWDTPARPGAGLLDALKSGPFAARGLRARARIAHRPPAPRNRAPGR